MTRDREGWQRNAQLESYPTRERGVYLFGNLDEKRHVTQRDKFEGATHGNSTRLKAIKAYLIHPYPPPPSSTSKPLPPLKKPSLLRNGLQLGVVVQNLSRTRPPVRIQNATKEKKIMHTIHHTGLV